MPEIWFWQRIISPHVAGLAVALANLGCRVVFVAEQKMSANRAAQGWLAPELPGVDLRYAPTKEEILFHVSKTPKGSIHLCQGIRANGLVAVAQREISRLGGSFWVIMEMVEDGGLSGVIKRLLYSLIFWRLRLSIKGVLAIGSRTPSWVHARGVSSDKIFLFAYFLNEIKALPSCGSGDINERFRFLFVGQLIPRKRLELLFQALSRIAKKYPRFVLQVVGAGPLEEELKAKAKELIGEKIEWMGQRSMEQVRHLMSEADCLVLPSRHDGWGAVVSEALMCGTPAICSDRCGAAEVVLASGNGGVFRSEDLNELELLMTRVLSEGRQPMSSRNALAIWACSLGALAGARYLMQVIEYRPNGGARPSAPWRRVGG